MGSLIYFLFICFMLYLIYLGALSLLSSFGVFQLKQKVKVEREALQKELDDLNREAFQAYHHLMRESMNVAKEEYQAHRQDFEPPVGRERKNVNDS